MAKPWSFNICIEQSYCQGLVSSLYMKQTAVCTLFLSIRDPLSPTRLNVSSFFNPDLIISFFWIANIWIFSLKKNLLLKHPGLIEILHVLCFKWVWTINIQHRWCSSGFVCVIGLHVHVKIFLKLSSKANWVSGSPVCGDSWHRSRGRKNVGRAGLENSLSSLFSSPTSSVMGKNKSEVHRRGWD